MAKSPKERLIDTLEQDILKSEAKIREEEANLENLKFERNELLRELCDEAVTTSQGPTILFTGYE